MAVLLTAITSLPYGKRKKPMPTCHQENVGGANDAAILTLIARIEALLQRPAESRDAVLRVGPLELDRIERVAKRGDRAIDLRPCEFRLLEYMMRHKEQILTRAVLLAEVWSYKCVPQTNLVDVHMGRLRRKVDKPHEPPMFYNVRGTGFILRVPAQGGGEPRIRPGFVKTEIQQHGDVT
jgi:DNA-binding winged helix-turn-helix (wHTH) protein